MANISEYVDRLQTLTQRNLEILKAINDSFYTKSEHLQVAVGDTNYVIPSFISLENKINALQDDFENLVYAPKTGEAYFNINGNSRRILMKGYSCTPRSIYIDPNNINGFQVEQNDVLKDFLTPNPYLKIDLQSLPNDVSYVNVRKVVAKNDILKDVLKSHLAKASMVSMSWPDLYKILAANFVEDKDYIMYDTRRTLPIRQSLGTGTYTIQSIDKDEVTADLEEYYTLTLHEELKYLKFDGTIEVPLSVGDQLVTYDDGAKMEIVWLNPVTRQIKIRVLNGDYLNLTADPDNTLSSDVCKLKFFSSVDYNLDKYINVPLEEDPIVAIFVAAIDNTLNVQAPWGGGLLVDTDILGRADDNTIKFKDYYEDNVRNIGDVLYEMSAAMTTSIMKYTENEFNEFTKYTPTQNNIHVKVLQINNHLNNSSTVQQIRSLYTQKYDLKTEMDRIQTNIADITSKLSEVSFNDSDNLRSTYEDQLSQYNSQKNDAYNTMARIVNEINLAANNSDIPIENAKYHIRGYFDWDVSNDPILYKYKQHVCGIKVQYRYKNSESDISSATSIDDKFIFSDWNDMTYIPLNRVPTYRSGYRFGYPQYDNGDGTMTTNHNNGKLNEPSFNQIDIPISQGEIVDIRIKIVWDFGAPFVETTSQWSAPYTVSFPTEFAKDLQLLDIVTENTKDYEQNKFVNILQENGVSKHVDDILVDQDVTFFHKPDHISSGFYTEERRVIPLRDKLNDMNAQIIALQDAINNTNSNNIACTITTEEYTSNISKNQISNVTLPVYQGHTGIYDTMATLNIKNISKTNSVYLYSMFGGNGSVLLNSLNPGKYKFTLDDYAVTGNMNKGVYIGFPTVSDEAMNVVDGVSRTSSFNLQTANQWVTFRMNDAYTGTKYYGDYNDDMTDSETINRNELNTNHIDALTTKFGMIVYPYAVDEDYFKLHGDNATDKLVLAPGESISISFMIHYCFNPEKTTSRFNKYISFDLRTSLYSDPINYVIKFIANYQDSAQEKLIKASMNRQVNVSSLTPNDKSYNPTIN